MAVQAGEGTRDIIYHTTSVPAGPHTYGGYLSRPDYRGQWPTVLIFGPEPTPTSTIKDVCRVLARHGIAALAPDLTDSHDQNLSISRSVASFLADPSGEWSNAQFGYGVLCFGFGLVDLAGLAERDGRVVAHACVGSRMTDDVAAKLQTADIPGLAIMSRDDDSTDVDAFVALRESLTKTTFVVYPTGGAGFWDSSAEGYDDDRYTDTMNRLIAFFDDTLPPRV